MDEYDKLSGKKQEKLKNFEKYFGERINPIEIRKMSSFNKLFGGEMGEKPKGLEKELREAIKRNPNDAVAHLQLGSLLGMFGRFEEAEKELREVIRIDPNNADAHFNLGSLLGMLGRFEEAEKKLRETIKIAPYSINAQRAHQLLGVLLVMRGRFEEANKE